MKTLGTFLASVPGSALRVFVGSVLGSLVIWLTNGNTFHTLGWTDLELWVGAAVTVALPVLIAWVNPQDPRFGRGSTG